MKNKYIVNGDKVKIIINSVKYGEQEAMVDLCDLNILLNFDVTWVLLSSKKSKTFYAITKFKKNGKRVHTLLHRFLLKPDNNLVIDHKNHNGLDNRRKNMRIVTYMANSQNINIIKNNTSGYKNVFWNKNRRKWEVQVKVKGEKQFGGYFIRKDDAIVKAGEIRKTLHKYAL